MKKSLKRISKILVFISSLYLSIIPTNGFNSEIFANVDQYILDSMKQSKTSALTLTIIQDENIIYQKVYQTDNFNVKVGLSTPFYIGSISKSFTALAIKQLANSGRIDINERVSNYLP